MSRSRRAKKGKSTAGNDVPHKQRKNGDPTGPKSMVIRIGASDVGPGVTQLVKDVRSVLEPGTASRLQERRSNRLRDYTAMAGPLGVSHLLLFSRSSSGNTNLRLALTPRGPTLNFRVDKYSLAKDVRNSQRHAQMLGTEHVTPPLLVMNNFITQSSHDERTNAVPKNLESLSTSVFQSLFPSISPQTTPLSSIRRVLLLNRELEHDADGAETGQYVLNFRHYAITTKKTGLSRGIKRLNAAERMVKQRSSKKHKVPSLGKLEDIADYLLDPSAAAGFTSGSESEADSDAGVEVLEPKQKRIPNRKQVDGKRVNGSQSTEQTTNGVEKRYVKLVELGPRMKLRMTKVEEGLCDGKILWHEYIHKSEDEVKKMEQVWEQRKEEKEERRKVQKENVERKRAEKQAARRSKPNEGNEEAAQDEDMDDDEEEEWDDDMMED